MSWRRHAALLLVVGALAACRTGRNYESPAGPRYAGGPLASPDSAAAGTVLDVRRTSDHRPVWAVAMLH